MLYFCGLMRQSHRSIFFDLNGLGMNVLSLYRKLYGEKTIEGLKTMCKIPITVKKCGLCRGNALLRYEKMKGYIEGSFFDVYECSSCNATFVDPLKSDEKIYDYMLTNDTLRCIILAYASKTSQKSYYNFSNKKSN